MCVGNGERGGLLVALLFMNSAGAFLVDRQARVILSYSGCIRPNGNTVRVSEDGAVLSVSLLISPPECHP